MSKNVTVTVIGSLPKVMEVSTPSDAISKLGLTGNYTATINGEAASLDKAIPEFSFLTLAVAVKGGK